jgi:hypothetical protein
MAATRYAAHATAYANIVFRNRLEARWAAFFDALAWRWVYEPFDLAGWVPDCSLVGPNDNTILIEVKSFIFDARHDAVGHAKVIDKINHALVGSDWEALLLGAAPFTLTSGSLYGLIAENTGGGFWCQPALFTGSCREGFGLTANLHLATHNHEYLQAVWADASNQTRWRP